MNILVAENLSYTYSQSTSLENAAVDNISFNIEKGEILGIIGHTGSGKSTVLQLLNGLLKPTSGRILFNGKDIWENPKKIKDIRSKIGLVFQYPEYQLFEETVYDDIAFAPKNMGLDNLQIDMLVNSAADTVGLSRELLKKSPFDLSGGEKRRAAIAGIMAMKPEILVFDEPTAGLDPLGRDIVLKAMLEYRKVNNATIVIVSHSMEDIARYADRILVMNDGKVVMQDTVNEVFKKASLLKEIGLNVPYITSVMLSLIEKGYNLPSNVYTVDDAVKVLLPLMKGGKTNA